MTTLPTGRIYGVDSLAREIVYRLIEADEPVVPGGEPERPHRPERPPLKAPEAEWDAYFEALKTYTEAMRKYDAWVDSQLDDEGAPKPDESEEDARWAEYNATHQHPLVQRVTRSWGEREVLKYDHLPADQPIPLADKAPFIVFEWGNFAFVQMPADVNFIKQEGRNMNHCLAVDYRRYAERLASGAQLQFSMVDKRDEMPKVDTEVSLTQASYVSDKITRPVVTQIRGLRNQCPPADEYVEPLIRFYETVGKDWQLTGHGVRNFDGGRDGEKLVRRWKEMQAER